jgi:hypothetical protein
MYEFGVPYVQDENKFVYEFFIVWLIAQQNPKILHIFSDIPHSVWHPWKTDLPDAETSTC